MEARKPRQLYRNWISSAGMVVAGVTAFIIIFFFSLSFVVERVSPYIGLIVYIVLPGFLILGLLLIPVGMFAEWRHRQRTGVATYRRWPSLDLNNPVQRRAAFLFLLGSVLFMLLSAVGIYQTYHFTESVEFCGLTCHRVMKPEYTTYHASPHARVRCVNCHIGPGADWYARSKVSGLYQFYAVLTNSYPRPIPTPIEDLRPARETCETCHWPRAFFGSKQRLYVHYLYNRSNSPWPVNMLLKIGGGGPKTSETAGIHWHMNIAVIVEYVARDERRLDIPWIRVTDKVTGRVTVYRDTENPLTPKELEQARTRSMDCMDCHNRPSHDFQSPDHAIDVALETGLIDPDLPEIKKTAVEAMVKGYPTEAEALKQIAAFITDFYRTRYPRISERQEKEIQQAILATQAAYSRNIFPIMKASWLDYPNDIGHFLFPGCMRCHDGKHASSTGTAVPNNCRSCHIILAQGPARAEKMIEAEDGIPFVHPVDIGDAWKQGTCYECHTGVQP